MPPGRALQPITQFLQRDPKEGAEPSFKTEARVAYDATALYIAVQAFDPEPQRIVGMRTRRDERSPSDWVSVLVDSFHDRRSAFEFARQSRRRQAGQLLVQRYEQRPGLGCGVGRRGVARRGGMARASSDPVLAAAVPPVRRGDLRTRGGPRDRPTERDVDLAAARQERERLRLVIRRVDRLELDRSPKRLEVVPYVVGAREDAGGRARQPACRRPPTRQLGRRRSASTRSRPGLTLTGTVNPDFGQVEADPAVVNLSAFETFFSERRPFFVEGSRHLPVRHRLQRRQLQRTVLFAPNRPLAAEAARRCRMAGSRAHRHRRRSWAPAKLTGRLGAFSIGALTAVTSEENAVIVNGSRQNPPGDRAADWIQRHPGAARVQEPVVVRLHGHRRRTGRLDNATRFLPGQAYTGGLDFDWRLNSKYADPGISRRKRRPWRCRRDRRAAAEQRAPAFSVRIRPRSTTIRRARR